jgi:hypothetical protein
MILEVKVDVDDERRAKAAESHHPPPPPPPELRPPPYVDDDDDHPPEDGIPKFLDGLELARRGLVLASTRATRSTSAGPWPGTRRPS